MISSSAYIYRPAISHCAHVALAMVVLCLATRMAWAQNAPTELVRLSQHNHTTWTADQGLPQNSVFDVLQTRDGYLWLATQSGLSRFDGIQFKTLTRRDGLLSDEISVLYESSDGALWVGTNGGGVSRLKDGSITSFTTENGLHSNLIRSITEARDGAMWIGTIDGGLHRIDGQRITHYDADDGLAGNVVLAIYEREDGSLWIGTEGGLSVLRGAEIENITTANGLPADLVWTITEDATGDVWIGTGGGLVRYGDGAFEAFTTEDGLCGNDVDALAHADGALWIGTLGGGLCRLANGRFDSFTSAHGLTNDRVRSVAVDREGNLWAGTERGGLDKLTRGKFTHTTTAEGLAHDVTLTVLETRAGAVWVGTEGEGVSIIEGGVVTAALSTKDGLPTNEIYALEEDAAGRVWIGMYGGGVCRVDEAGEGKHVVQDCLSTEHGLPSNDVYSLKADDAGTLWVGTLAGLALVEDGAVRKNWIVERVGDVPITAIHKDAAGVLWIGTYDDGITRVDGRRAVHLTAENGLSSEIVLTFYEGADGTLWAGMQSGGLCRLVEANAQCLSTDDGFPTDNVLQIVDDEAGDLWLGTLQGVVRIEQDEIQDHLSGAGGAFEYELFDKGDGLKVSEMNGGTQPSAWRSHSGRLWFTTNAGIANVDPDKLRRNTLPPMVHVEGIAVEDQPVSLQGEIALPPGSRDVTFHYTGISFTAPEEVRFRYKLEGYDDHWVEAGTRREAYYTNLAPGTYTFRVTAVNNDGVWNEDGASVGFYLEPYFYQTWWFKWLCIAAALAAAFTGYRLRIRQLKERERALERVVDERTRDLRREKERTEEAKRVIEGQAHQLRELDRFKTKFFANVSHEFRTPLTMIIGPLENMLAGLYEPLSGTMKQQSEMMLRNALRLMRLINQLLDLSKLEDGKMKLRARQRDIVSFLEGIVLSCSSFADRKGIAVRFEADDERLLLTFEPDKFEKVFYNLLSNATKFTPKGGSITVSVAQRPADADYPEGSAVVKVTDTGKGIPADQLPYIFDRFHQVDGTDGWDHEGTGIGLALVKEMILLHGGEVAVDSELGVGTEFTITLPMGTAHLEADQVTEDDLSEEISDDGGALSQLATSDFNYMHDDEAAPELTGQAKAGYGAPLILVVDDNKDVREYVAGVLGDEYRIATACDGAEGLEKAREVMPDLILSDVMMPNVDGNAFCRRVKSSRELNHIPVILLTARATHQLKIEGLEVGADDYIPKPFNVRELKVRIKNLLQLRRQEKELKILNDHLEEKVREQFDQLVDERRRYEADLVDAKEKAEASDRLKTNILNNLSHEFRTPLTAILGFSEVIRCEAPDELHEFTHEIEKGGKRLLGTLDSLLSLSRIEADEVDAGRESVDVDAVTQSIVDSFAGQADARGIDLHFEASKDGSTAHLNRAALDQVVNNLVDNALKFTREGRVDVRVERSSDAITIRIADTGVGISEAFLPKMYDAFVQESDGFTRNFEGCGLGLTIAKRLVELMDGTIHVESVPGEGSTFTVSLPVREAAAI